jgi:hypothetical protein
MLRNASVNIYVSMPIKEHPVALCVLLCWKGHGWMLMQIPGDLELWGCVSKKLSKIVSNADEQCTFVSNADDVASSSPMLTHSAMLTTIFFFFLKQTKQNKTNKKTTLTSLSSPFTTLAPPTTPWTPP